jgi:transcriptional regulator with XRE-family HTH domain
MMAPGTTPEGPTPSMSESDPDLVEQLRQAIRISGLSQRGLARITGISQGQLSRFMRGDRTLTLTVAAKLCVALRVRLVQADDPAGAERLTPVEPEPRVITSNDKKPPRKKSRGRGE